MRRDRDPAGRPRNARPRDALGRPLDRAGSGGAGFDGEGESADQAGIPEDLALAGPETARLADQLLRAGRPFHAHEVLEAAWKTGPADERDLWQGLAQVAVGLTHALRGNSRGATALLRRGSQRARAYQDAHQDRAGAPPAPDRPYGIDLAAFLAASDDLAARIERHGLADIPTADLRPGLTAPVN